MIAEMHRGYGQPTQGILNTDEVNKVKLYTEESFGSDVQRVVMYYERLRPTQKVKLVVTYGGTSVLMMGLGGAFGAGAGAGIGALTGFFYANVPGIVPGSYLGAKIGTAVGMVGGFCFGVYGSKIYFMSSKKYSTWYEDIKKEELGQIYEKILNDDPRFDPFICKITNALIAIPVKAPDGQIYEKEAVTMWIKARWNVIQRAHESGSQMAYIEQLRNTVSPIRGEPFQEEDLSFDKEYEGKLKQLILQKSSELEEVEQKRLFDIGSELILSDLRENRRIILEMQVGKIYTFVSEKKIPLIIGDTVVKRLREEFADV